MSSAATAPTSRPSPRPDDPADQPTGSTGPGAAGAVPRGCTAGAGSGVPFDALLAANRAARAVSTPPQAGPPQE